MKLILYANAGKPANIFNLRRSFPLFRNFANVMFVGYSRALEDIEEDVFSNINQTIFVSRAARYKKVMLLLSI